MPGVKQTPALTWKREKRTAGGVKHRSSDLPMREADQLKGYMINPTHSSERNGIPGIPWRKLLKY